jgi:hypothetical protein
MLAKSETNANVSSMLCAFVSRPAKRTSNASKGKRTSSQYQPYLRSRRSWSRAWLLEPQRRQEKMRLLWLDGKAPSGKFSFCGTPTRQIFLTRKFYHFERRGAASCLKRCLSACVAG